MDSFRRGFAFLKQSWQMARADPDLIKPTLLALVVGFLVTLVGSIPVVVTFVVFGDYGIGRVLGYILGAILIFVQFIVTYVFSAMTIYLIYGYLAEGDGRMDKAWGIVRRDFWDITSLAAVSTGINLLKGFIQGKGRSGVRNMAAGLLDTLWTEASYLILPAMVVEDLNLGDGVKRAAHIIRENLLLVGISTVGVRAVTGLIGFLLGATGVGLGLGVSLGLIALTNQATWATVSGITLGVLVAGVFILVGVVIGSYTTTAYHTCLYLWARDVERAQSNNLTVQSVNPPAPLAAAMH
jgi:hypothetical protein